MAELVDIVTKGSTSRSVPLRIIDSADGTPENAVTWNTTGINLWYRRERSAVVEITEATLASLTTAFTAGGFIYVRDGKYSLDLPDAALATGANYVDYGGTIPGMVVIGGRIRLIDQTWETAAVALPTIPTNWVTANGLATDAVAEIVAAIFARAFSSGYNSRLFGEMIGVIYAAVIAGNVSGAGGTSAVVRNPANTADVATLTVDASGNRSSITVTP